MPIQGIRKMLIQTEKQNKPPHFTLQRCHASRPFLINNSGIYNERGTTPQKQFVWHQSVQNSFKGMLRGKSAARSPRRYWRISLWQSLATHQFNSGSDQPLLATKLICFLFQLLNSPPSGLFLFSPKQPRQTIPFRLDLAIQSKLKQRADLCHAQHHLLSYGLPKNMKGRRMAMSFPWRFFTKLHKHLSNHFRANHAWQIFFKIVVF